MTVVLEATAVAPASVANLEVGFDILGLALAEPTDTVTARRLEQPGVAPLVITPEPTRLPRKPARNTAGIAARGVLEAAGITGWGVSLELHKGLPLCSGLGSSAASAVAAAVAVNRLAGEPLSVTELLTVCLKAEAAVSGAHLDNAAAALLGGLVLVRSVDPPAVSRLPLPEGLRVAVVMPAMRVETGQARKHLPASVTLQERTRSSAALASFVQACLTKDLDLLAQTPMDPEVHPLRAAAIPGCEDALAAAREAGALMAGISGSGPALFALCSDEASAAAVPAAMIAVFLAAGLDTSVWTCGADCPGALKRRDG